MDTPTEPTTVPIGLSFFVGGRESIRRQSTVTTRTWCRGTSTPSRSLRGSPDSGRAGRRLPCLPRRPARGPHRHLSRLRGGVVPAHGDRNHVPRRAGWHRCRCGRRDAESGRHDLDVRRVCPCLIADAFGSGAGSSRRSPFSVRQYELVAGGIGLGVRGGDERGDRGDAAS